VIVGIGLDLVQRSRMATALEKNGDRLRQRVFTPKEQAHGAKKAAAALHFGGVWAAKESLVKALGTGFTGGIRWHDIEISHDSLGKPQVTLSGKAKEIADQLGVSQIFVSISHDTDWSAAQVILQRDDNGD